MRALALVAVLAGSIGVVGCSTDVNMGGKIKTSSSALAGDACSQGSDCASGLCLGQICCALASCGADPACQGTSCNTSGACVYPTGTCGSHCFLGYLTPSMCSFGVCTSRNDARCPGNLGCASDTACRDSCEQTSDCADGFYCSNGSCPAQEFPGIGCTGNDVCKTGICGVAGSGHCCTTACVTGDPGGCGASDCDSVGDCIYPTATTSCVAQSCSGHELTNPANCSGAGTCATPTTADCAPYSCGSSGACKTSCAAAVDCWNAFCSTATATCCSFYSSNTIAVDGTQGVDQACCGSAPGTGACATIAYAAALAVDTGAMPMTLAVANPPNGKDWVADEYPIALSQGLILSAPGLYFAAIGLDAGPWELLLVSNPVSVADPAPTVVEGSASAPIHLGFDSQGNPSPSSDQYPGEWSDHSDVIDVDHAALNLLHAEIQSIGTGVRVGGQSVGACDAGCTTFDDGTLTVGNDGLGQSGTVWIGAPDAGGEYGIRCEAPAGFVNDTGSAVAPSLWVQNMYSGVYIESGCSLSLTSSPRFGPALNDAGACDAVSYDLGLLFGYTTAVGASKGVVNNATFECLSEGLVAVGSFSADHDLFQFNYLGVVLLLEDADAIADGGRIRLSNSVMRNNTNGVRAYGAVDLNIGNEISCNDMVPYDFNPYPLMNAGLETASYADPSWNVNAENILWDRWDPDAGQPQTWTCYVDTDAGGVPDGGCVCTGDPGCPEGSWTVDGPLWDRAGVLIFVYPDSGTGGVDVANGSTDPNGCP